MVREKRGADVSTRLDKIFESYCFNRLKKQFDDNQSFKKFIKDKVELVSGDLTKENLAMPEEDRKKVTENVNIIINSAASVKFDDQIQKGLGINYFGAIRMVDLAKECQNLDVMNHVSTCYVNCNKKGFIRE